MTKAEKEKKPSRPAPATPALPASGAADLAGADKPAELRPDPTRYGDWEKDGRCIDF
ncbi:MAG: DUF1674 domain-containing protein [Alphaproteobacteria bacterium]|jgi:hypothetical protein